jgi:hypothetical protein
MLSQEPSSARPAALGSPFRDDRVRMGLYVAVLVAQMVVVYGIFAWWI